MLDPSVRVYGPGASVAQDFEPEFITVSHDSETAWVAMQENNAFAIVDIEDAEVTDVDERLGRAIERMRETGLLDRTILIISADHGEELFEHGWVGHASTSYDGKLYDELIRIPLLIRLPNQSLTTTLLPCKS